MAQHHLQEPGDKAEGNESWDHLAEHRVGEKADCGAADWAQLSTEGKEQMPLA